MQAELRLCWSHIPHCWKSRVKAQIYYIISRHRTQSRTFAWYACFPLIWFGKTAEICVCVCVCERERERERKRETCNLKKYHVSVLQILLLRISFCTTKSDILQYALVYNIYLNIPPLDPRMGPDNVYTY